MHRLTPKSVRSHFVAFIAGFLLGAAFMASPATGLLLAILSGVLLSLSVPRREAHA